jgi:cyanophycinase-like exopeptidase
MKNIISLVIVTLVGFVNFISAQTYTSYFTGNTTDLEVTPSFGICLMGGAGEFDNAMKWFLEKANGGDVVIIRVDGSDGYNDYFFNDLGIDLNSVHTLIIPSIEAANDPFVLESLNKAEAIWIAGGDQYDYVSFWKNTPVEDAINNLINVKGGAIGGISAGMAIQGNYYFSAENGSVTTAEALANPYNYYLTLGNNDFIDAPFMSNLITDTHYDSPNRKGRHIAFLARMLQDGASSAFGIACNEYVAVCIEETGIAKVFGEYPEYPDEIAYFLQANCVGNSLPENCTLGEQLTWNNEEAAVKVYSVPGTPTGENYFSLVDWNSGNGGNWQNWWVENGVFNHTIDDEAADCVINSIPENTLNNFFNANYTNGMIIITSDKKISDTSILLFDILGKSIDFSLINKTENSILLKTKSPSAIYNVVLFDENNFQSAKVIIEN